MKKLNLKELEVTSFTTSEKNHFKGGEVTDAQECGETFTARPTMCTGVQFCIGLC